MRYRFFCIATLAVLLCFCSVGRANLVYNGGFESGNIGFTTDYTYSTDLVPEGVYAIGDDPHDYRPRQLRWERPAVKPDSI